MNEKIASALLFLLHIAGACVAFWLLRTHMNLAVGESDLQSSCSVFGAAVGGHGCEVVALSGFSTVGIFPLAGLALGYYLGQCLLLFWAGVNPQRRFEALYASHNLATFAVLVTLFMAAISAFVIKSFCIGCASLWAINALVWLVTPFRAGFGFSKIVCANWESFRHKDMKLLFPRVRKSWIFVGVVSLGVGALAAAVLASEKEKYSMGGMVMAMQRYDGAPQMFLPPEAYEGDRAKGVATADAVLTVVEFADFQCPACKKGAQFFKPFFLRNKDKVHFIFRNYPLDAACNPNSGGMHVMACAAATAGICAAKQGKFYEFHDLAFDRQEDLSPAMLKEVVEKLGLDQAKFAACAQSQETKDEITRDITWADSISLRSTPTFVVNGRKIEGGFTPEQWEELLRRAPRK